MHLKRASAAIFAVVAVVCAGGAVAQTFPSKPPRLIVTYPPGGSSDLMGRVLGQKHSELWGQQVIIESKPGAQGSIGMEFAARQPADGHTFVIGNLLCFGGNGLVTVAEQDVPSGLTALIIGSVPLWVVLMRLSEGDRPGRGTLR